ncbi:hypothetical protein AV530_002484 [Patagioenas fasciata monilis]|uniref:Uncharacterized protein n=1 Tax=Patagioenas fasciata monilis TaxID=372326 RepID=A0A1V4K6J1_PATFA|nr:hypothetical protein AV530_002484 [Patagioenas fasciata monilis]
MIGWHSNWLLPPLTYSAKAETSGGQTSFTVVCRNTRRKMTLPCTWKCCNMEREVEVFERKLERLTLLMFSINQNLQTAVVISIFLQEPPL